MDVGLSRNNHIFCAINLNSEDAKLILGICRNDMKCFDESILKPASASEDINYLTFSPADESTDYKSHNFEDVVYFSDNSLDEDEEMNKNIFYDYPDLEYGSSMVQFDPFSAFTASQVKFEEKRGNEKKITDKSDKRIFGRIGRADKSIYGRIGRSDKNIYARLGRADKSINGRIGRADKSIYARIGRADKSIYGRIGRSDKSIFGRIGRSMNSDKHIFARLGRSKKDLTSAQNLHSTIESSESKASAEKDTNRKLQNITLPQTKPTWKKTLR